MARRVGRRSKAVCLSSGAATFLYLLIADALTGLMEVRAQPIDIL